MWGERMGRNLGITQEKRKGSGNYRDLDMASGGGESKQEKKKQPPSISNQRSSQPFSHTTVRFPCSMPQSHPLMIRVITYRLRMNIGRRAMILGMTRIVSTDETFTLDRC